MFKHLQKVFLMLVLCSMVILNVKPVFAGSDYPSLSNDEPPTVSVNPITVKFDTYYQATIQFYWPGPTLCGPMEDSTIRFILTDADGNTTILWEGSIFDLFDWDDGMVKFTFNVELPGTYTVHIETNDPSAPWEWDPSYSTTFTATPIYALGPPLKLKPIVK